MKNIIVFSKEWFEYHQGKLLKFANTRFGRYVLRIHGKRSAVGKNKIIKLEPHAITWKEDGKFKTEFRTHAKFAKRLYHAFKPVWHLFHAWDMMVANKLNVALNLGFDSLVAYPDASSGGDTIDGTITLGSVNTWSHLRNAAAAFDIDKSGNEIAVQIESYSTSNIWSSIGRGYLFFDTSTLGENSEVISGSIVLTKSVSANTFGANSFGINTYSVTTSSYNDLVSTDYNTNKFGSTALATTISYSAFSSSTTSELVLNASGITHINMTGITKFGLREANYDATGTAPTWESSKLVYLWSRSADASGTATDPCLLIGYTPPVDVTISTSNPYADGKLMSNSGSGWSDVTSSDLYFVTNTTDGATTITYSSQDPSSILTDVIDNYSSNNGVITYNATVDTTSTTVSYTFNTQTILQCINKIIELAPANWYWYVDPATNYIHMHEKPSVATHTFTLGKNIRLMRVEKRIEDIVNTIYFVGGDTGGGENLYLRFQDSTSVSQYGLRSMVYTDQRVSLTATATTISNKILQEKSSPEVRLMIEVSDSNGSGGYDIESIKVGDVINIRNVTGSSGSSLWDVMMWDVDYWDYNLTQLATMYLQIVRLEYKPDYIRIHCSTVPPEVSKRIEDINRNVEAILTNANPTAPA